MRSIATTLPALLLLGCGSGPAAASGAPPALPSGDPPPAAQARPGREEEDPPQAPVSIPDALQPHKRTTYLPVCTRGEEGEANGSRFGGRPWLPQDVVWPTCPGCERQMTLFAQLRVADLPAPPPVPGEGLLQLFYCTSSDPLCEDDLESYAPFGRGTRARFVPDSEGALGVPQSVEPLAPHRIDGWTPADDYPHYEDQEELGVELDDDAFDAVSDAGFPRDGDKWLGWPAWIQGAELPDCPRCGRQLAFLLQIDSNAHVDYMFGDCGTGHLSGCPDHPDELSFHWACS